MNRLFKLLTGICISLLALSSCEKQEPVDIDNNDYTLYYYAYVPQLTTQTTITKDQENLFKLFSDLYDQRLKSIPGYMGTSKEGEFKIQGKTLYAAVNDVAESLQQIQNDITAISNSTGIDFMSRIDFAFVISVGYIASDGTGADFYKKVYGEQFFTYDPSIR